MQELKSRYPVLEQAKAHTYIDSATYDAMYKLSIEQPEVFWAEQADKFLDWYQPWDHVSDVDLKSADIKWFSGGKLNVSYNCIDRHLVSKANETAIIWEGDDPSEDKKISYQELHDHVCRFANLLKARGVKKGDRVCIYMPMIPEIGYAMLACARIGAVHSVVFGGFSTEAIRSRIIDADCQVVITSDESLRGGRVIPIKSNVDAAIADCPNVHSVIVVERTGGDITWNDKVDVNYQQEVAKLPAACQPEVMDAEDPLFILYTSGSTGKPKGMVHTIAGYMVYTAYTFKNVFQYRDNDVYWCTADIGWITGHSYIVYGPLANGATSVMFEGVPSYPDYGRFWEIVEKHKVSQFYTAPTAIRALAKQGSDFVDKYDLSSLKVLGSVGEPINEEAWHWYNENVGKKKSPIVDTWWQTETGGIMITPIPFSTPTKPTYATLPFIGVQPALMDESGKELKGNQVEGRLCIKFPWPSMARTIWGNHQRYKDTYFSAYDNMYFTGDGALRDEVGYYRITGRVDDVIIVSGHNLGTAPIEDAINEHPAVSESAIVGFPHDVKGNALYGYVTLKDVGESRNHDNLRMEINQVITDRIGPIAKLDKIQFTEALPKTRSGKIMRRILRKIAANETDQLGDTSTLLNPEVVQKIIDNVK
jgi:acetyl-CoA synthetase